MPATMEVLCACTGVTLIWVAQWPKKNDVGPGVGNGALIATIGQCWRKAL